MFMTLRVCELGVFAEPAGPLWVEKIPYPGVGDADVWVTPMFHTKHSSTWNSVHALASTPFSAAIACL